MLQIAIALIIGFALGYGVREWVSRRRRQAERESDVPLAAGTFRSAARSKGRARGTSLLTPVADVNQARFPLRVRRLFTISNTAPARGLAARSSRPPWKSSLSRTCLHLLSTRLLSTLSPMAFAL